MRGRRRIEGFLILAAPFATGVALAHASALVWALLMALAALGAYMLGRLQGQRPARKPQTEFAKRKRAAQRAAGTAAVPRSAQPPASTGLIPLMVSEFCADDGCILCPGNGCECTCGHDRAEIGRRNTEKYDKAKSS